MKKIFYLLSLAVASLILSSCDPEVDAPDIDVPEVSYDYFSYVEPQYPADFGVNKPYMNAYGSDGIEDLNKYVEDNFNGWATLAANAGVSAMGKALEGYTGITGLGTVFKKAINLILPLGGTQRDSAMIRFDKIEKQMIEISGKLDDISRQIEQTNDYIREGALNSVFLSQQEFDSKLKSLFLLTYEYYDYLSNPAKCSSEEDAIALIREWAKSPVGGDSYAYNAAVNLANSLVNFRFRYVDGVNYNYLTAFDFYAFTEFDWEADGYPFREAYRADVATGITLALNLSFLYYSLNDSGLGVKNTQKAMNAVAQFFESSAVKHRDDLAVCQIADCHFSMPVRPTIYNAHMGGALSGGYSPDLTFTSSSLLRLCCENTVFGMYSLAELMGVPTWKNQKNLEDQVLYKISQTDCDDFIARQFSAKEMKTLVSHYQNAGSTFLRILRDYGGVKGLDYYISSPYFQDEETPGDYTLIATDKVRYDPYIPHYSSDFHDCYCVLSGYASATAYPNKFDRYLTETFTQPDAYQAYVTQTEDPDRDSALSTSFKLCSSVNMPGTNFIFFEPSEITRY